MTLHSICLLDGCCRKQRGDKNPRSDNQGRATVTPQVQPLLPNILCRKGVVVDTTECGEEEHGWGVGVELIEARE